jgi:uncharacterized protein YjbI with pentapeptide repeats
VPQLLDRIGFSPFAVLQNHDLRRVDLAGANLRYADLTGANLEGANLTGANLRRAIINQVKAEDSHWRRAYLDGASLIGADLTKADLRQVHAFRTDLSDTKLKDADASAASLSHANLAGSLISGLRLDDAYLRFTENLEQSQLSSACGNAKTRLPEGLSIRHCGKRLQHN